MSNKTLTGSIALTKLTRAVIVDKKNKAGEMVKCVLLPIEGNHITLKDGAVYMDVRVVIREEQDQYGQNGFVAKSLPSEVYNANKGNNDWLNANQPILGNLKDWSQGSGGSAPVQTVDDDDDLPF